ncbi:hypothetical protein ACFV0C_08435 [Streptomyces sp. NPDC059568]|uniref:hypothetical protein n=1 Tax=Streptomyces sp. NPDC059568 TaxID=3346868 RepID=UPI0036CB8D07
MTRCAKGNHDFPVEDEHGARCDIHGVTLVWHGPPITEDNLPGDDGPSRIARPTLGPAPSQRPH